MRIRRCFTRASALSCNLFKARQTAVSKNGEVPTRPVLPRVCDEMSIAMNCLKCGCPVTYRFCVLEIHTLHLREPMGEKRIQALGEIVEYGACRACAAKYLEDMKHPPVKQIASFGGIGLMGLVTTIAFWEGSSAFRLCGLAGVVCGVLGIVSSMQTMRRNRQDFEGFSSEMMLEKAAWETVLLCAPKKCDDHDITYLPINRKTLQLKNGDLMVLYNLLPEIAKKAWHMIREL